MNDPAATTVLTNAELARVFHEIGDMLEVKGELVFKTVAYHRAADAIAHSPIEVARAYVSGTPPRIAGVGDAIAAKIVELARTGRMEFYERLRLEVPPSLVELLGIPGVGPRTVRQLHEELGVLASTDDILGTLDDYPTRSGYLIAPVVVWSPGVTVIPNPGEVAAAYRIACSELFREGSPEIVAIEESERPIIRLPLPVANVNAPTAAVLYQFREVALAGSDTRVDHFEQPVFAWR